jgi:hypothetical protein
MDTTYGIRGAAWREIMRDTGEGVGGPGRSGNMRQKKESVDI